MTCPKCNQPHVRRVERISTMDNALNWLFFKPWSCHDCRNRFYALREDLGPKIIRMRIASRLSGSGFRKNRKRDRRELVIYVFAALLLMALIYSLIQQRIAQ